MSVSEDAPENSEEDKRGPDEAIDAADLEKMLALIAAACVAMVTVSLPLNRLNIKTRMLTASLCSFVAADCWA